MTKTNNNTYDMDDEACGSWELVMDEFKSPTKTGRGAQSTPPFAPQKAPAKPSNRERLVKRLNLDYIEDVDSDSDSDSDSDNDINNKSLSSCSCSNLDIRGPSIVKDNIIIRPCINVVFQDRGRVGTYNHNMHFTPNSEKTLLGKWIRRLYRARKGYTYIIADWSAQELATLGYLTDDAEFIKAYNDSDLHLETASRIFSDQKCFINNLTGEDAAINLDISSENINIRNNIIANREKIYLLVKGNRSGNILKIEIALKNTDLGDKTNKGVININDKEIATKLKSFIDKNGSYSIDWCSKNQRGMAKSFNFGAVYGRSVSGYAEELQIDEAIIREKLNKWFETNKAITKFMDDTMKTTYLYGYSKTLKNDRGRRNFYPETLNQIPKIVNKSLSNSVQFKNSGTAADLLKSVLRDFSILLDSEEDHNKKDCHIVHTMHDEIVFEVRDDLIDEWKSKIEDLMMYPKLFRDNGRKFKIKIDIDICKWWDSCKVDDEYSWDLCERDGKLETCE